MKIKPDTHAKWIEAQKLIPAGLKKKVIAEQVGLTQTRISQLWKTLPPEVRAEWQEKRDRATYRKRRKHSPDEYPVTLSLEVMTEYDPDVASRRKEAMLECYRQTLSIRAVAREFGVCDQRVRQILGPIKQIKRAVQEETW